jgi:hypothetical protein
MSETKLLRSALLAVFGLVSIFGPLLLADDDDEKNIQSGYAIITPTSGNTTGLVVFETFGEKRGTETTQAGVLPADMTTSVMLFVSTSGRLSRNLGVAIANPGSTDATVILTLRRDDGTSIGTKTIVVKAKNQTSQFVTQIFADQPSVPKDLTGTLNITSNVPVAIVGLRFRGENFSTIPATNLSAPTAVPVVSPGVGGTGAVILPHFASGGGWSAEIVLANSGGLALPVRVDLFKQDGTPLVVTLNGQKASSFTSLTIPANGVIVLSPRDKNDDSDF